MRNSCGSSSEKVPEKKRRLTAGQIELLETSFKRESKLEAERKKSLADDLGLQPRQVAVWFQNRRTREKAKRLEHDFAVLKSHCDSAMAEREKLRAEVMRLTAQLQAKQDVNESEDERKDRNSHGDNTETSTEGEESIVEGGVGGNGSREMDMLCLGDLCNYYYASYLVEDHFLNHDVQEMLPLSHEPFLLGW